MAFILSIKGFAPFVYYNILILAGKDKEKDQEKTTIMKGISR